MRNFFILVFLALVGFLIYQHVIPKDPKQVRVYKSVVDAWTRGDMATIRPMCADPRVEMMFETRSLANLSQPVGISNVIEVKHEGVTSAQGEAVTDYTVKGQVLVFFNPPGVQSTYVATFRGVFEFTMGLRTVARQWTVTSISIAPKEVREYKFKR